MNKREQIQERLEYMEEGALTLDNFDEAIIGLSEVGTDKPKVVYSRQKCIEILVEGLIQSDDDTEEDIWTQAVEFFEFNTLRACRYMGDDSPIIVDDTDL